jgi:3-oxoacyl-[acyl-carrier-protein] synthase II
MSRRVVITGLGALTPIGNSIPEFWDNLLKELVVLALLLVLILPNSKLSLRVKLKTLLQQIFLIGKKQESSICMPFTLWLQHQRLLLILA